MSDDPNNTMCNADFDESADPALTTSSGQPAFDDHAPRNGSDGAFTVANDAASEVAR